MTRHHIKQISSITSKSKLLDKNKNRALKLSEKKVIHVDSKSAPKYSFVDKPLEILNNALKVNENQQHFRRHYDLLANRVMNNSYRKNPTKKKFEGSLKNRKTRTRNIKKN